MLNLRTPNWGSTTVLEAVVKSIWCKVFTHPPPLLLALCLRPFPLVLTCHTQHAPSSHPTSVQPLDGGVLQVWMERLLLPLCTLWPALLMPVGKMERGAPVT